jgi:peptide/nickel transport system substrate-binding protein
MNSHITRLLSILILFACIQCRWNEPPPTNTIIFALSNEPKSLDPRFATDANSQRILKLVFSSLVRVGPDLEIVGDLATHWTYKNLVYRFTLAPLAVFHDGKHLTFADFEFSVKEYQKSLSPFSAQFDIIEKVSGNYTFNSGGVLEIKLKRFSASFLNDLPSLSILPKSNVEKLKELFYQQPIGSGAFKVERVDIKNIYLSRNENYYHNKAITEKIQFKVIKDSNTRFLKMYKGQIDIIQSDVPFSKIRVFKESNKFNVYSEPSLSTTYILLNLRKKFLKNIDVRLAMSAAINREAIIKYTHEGYAIAATSILTTANKYHLYHLKYHSISSEEIQKIFKLQGHEALILKTSNSQEAIENGKIISHQLREKGLKIIQQSNDWSTYYEDVQNGNFDLAIMKWVGINDPDIYRISLHSKMTPPQRNRGYYNNPIFDKIVDSAIEEPDPLKRMSLYHHAQQIVFAELPTIPLWYEKQIAITHKRVKDYQLPLNGDFSALMKVYKNAQ